MPRLPTPEEQRELAKALYRTWKGAQARAEESGDERRKRITAERVAEAVTMLRRLGVDPIRGRRP
jgi:hypothetical protein